MLLRFSKAFRCLKTQTGAFWEFQKLQALGELNIYLCLQVPKTFLKSSPMFLCAVWERMLNTLQHQSVGDFYVGEFRKPKSHVRARARARVCTCVSRPSTSIAIEILKTKLSSCYSEGGLVLMGKEKREMQN